mgnify:CR=1 FL=1
MKEIVLKVEEDRYEFFIELVKSLDFVHVEHEGDSKEEILANIRQGFEEMKAFKEGKIEGKPLEDFLNEL